MNKNLITEKDFICGWKPTPQTAHAVILDIRILPSIRLNYVCFILYLKDVLWTFVVGCYQRCFVLSDRNLAELGAAHKSVSYFCRISLVSYLDKWMTKHKRLKTMPFSLCHIGWHGATTRVSCQAYPNRSKTKGFLYNCLSKYRGKVIYRTEDSRIDPPRFLISPAAAFEYQNKNNKKRAKKP